MAAKSGIRGQRRRGNPKALAPAGARKLAASSRRQCAVCRATRAPEELILLVPLSPSEATRPSYLCAVRRCIDAWAQIVVKASRRDFHDELRALCTRRLIEALGLARRQNQIVHGTERLLQVAAREPVALLCASDAAKRSIDKFARMGAEIMPTPLDALALGHAIGQAPIIALTIADGRHAQQAAHWLRVWYEAHPASGPQLEQAGHKLAKDLVATRRDAIDDVIEVVR